MSAADKLRSSFRSSVVKSSMLSSWSFEESPHSLNAFQTVVRKTFDAGDSACGGGAMK